MPAKAPHSQKLIAVVNCRAELAAGNLQKCFPMQSAVFYWESDDCCDNQHRLLPNPLPLKIQEPATLLDTQSMHDRLYSISLPSRILSFLSGKHKYIKEVTVTLPVLPSPGWSGRCHYGQLHRSVKLPPVGLRPRHKTEMSQGHSDSCVIHRRSLCLLLPHPRPFQQRMGQQCHPLCLYSSALR